MGLVKPMIYIAYGKFTAWVKLSNTGILWSTLMQEKICTLVGYNLMVNSIHKSIVVHPLCYKVLEFSREHLRLESAFGTLLLRLEQARGVCAAVIAADNECTGIPSALPHVLSDTERETVVSWKQT